MKYLKSLLFIFAILIMNVSCDSTGVNEDQEKLSDDSAMNWKLTKMSGNMQGSERTGSDMEYQESYSFNKDKTFTKVRTQNGQTRQAKGTYEKVEKGSEKYFELTFDEDSELIGNCTGDNKELLYFQSESTLNSSWSACDGPGLLYELQ
ncbi:hypothetical protein [Fulvivirga ligni]|uniref:hypothetical protein n=1 Tax=Fulvivirga ligni TaxID=2904246 RepID=UPI001F1E1E91|nr:hypothetical protein [Fulvivirga ligni]UII22507.1 hypothetical protein LVD16_04600 [Fulvivirga ligni]